MNMWVIHWIPAFAGMTEGGLKERGEKYKLGGTPRPPAPIMSGHLFGIATPDI